MSKTIPNIIFMLIVNCSLLIAQNKLDVITIDPGHGGKDPGTIGVTGVLEKNIVLAIALKLGDLIQKKFPEIKIVFTRSNDDFPSLRDRTRVANENKSKLFISIHANHKKMDETEKSGFEIYMMTREHFPDAIDITMRENSWLKFQKVGTDTTDNFIFSTLAQNGYYKFNEFLASNVEINMLNYTQIHSRGIMQAGFVVVIGASMPSILVETGYVSDPTEEKYLTSSTGQTAIATGLFNAFVNFKYIYESN
jgi:N-acetylmuramoyl-L-alanine amidase